MSERKRRIVATAALPYANGEIHIGHLLEYLQTDFWVRFQKMRGHECLYICADDTHGTPIMIAARNKGITPEALIEKAHDEHVADFEAFEIDFDNYGSTNSDENRGLAELIFKKMDEGGHIASRTISQSYCEHDRMFLPDRFVKGTCPKCGAEDQYGDSCDACGATYTPPELKDAKCAQCGTPPVERESEHLFFQLSDFRDFLGEWVPRHTQPEIARKLDEWLSGELRDWDISRDEPYFGFAIPGHPGKFFYVWLDAPVGYISSTKQWCERNGRNLSDFWASEEAEVHHFIGKDIVYFHTLFWPSMLKAAGFSTPQKVMVHGFVKVNGQKMSKSKGTFLNAKTFLKHVDPIYLRYYYACKLSSSVDDIDLNLSDFVSRVNSDLIGKITNVASRGFQMLHKKLDGRAGSIPEDGQKLLQAARARGETIAEHFENSDFAKAMLEIREIADSANNYFDSYEPWKLVGNDPEMARGVLTTLINLFRVMAVYLKPILPSYAKTVEELFGEEPYQWSSIHETVENKALNPFSHIAKRLDPKAVDRMIEENRGESKEPKKAQKKKGGKKQESEETSEITFDDFMKVDLRVAKVTAAEDVEGADKLLKVTLDTGSSQKTVFAGIKSAYSAEDLTGRQVIFVSNLQPRKMKFGVSEGMILATGEGKNIRLITPDGEGKPGDRVS